MKERPILFSSSMVGAILSGRKNQTRRVASVQPYRDDDGLWHCLYPWGDAGHGIYTSEDEMRAEYDRLMLAHCPYGAPGDRLWVRETWAELLAVSPATDQPIPITDGERLIEPPTKGSDGRWRYDGKVIAYRANSDIEFCDGDGFTGKDAGERPRWRPSIHMPRWAARLVLPVTGMKVERLQDISEEDALAEGIERHVDDGVTYYGPHDRGIACPIAAFSWLWDSINGKPRKRADGSLGPDISWAANPWVWAVEFSPMVAESKVA